MSKMMAYSCASGGVIFVPEKIERKTNADAAPVSYAELAEQQAPPKRRPLFSFRRKKKDKPATKAA